MFRFLANVVLMRNVVLYEAASSTFLCLSIQEICNLKFNLHSTHESSNVFSHLNPTIPKNTLPITQTPVYVTNDHALMIKIRLNTLSPSVVVARYAADRYTTIDTDIRDGTYWVLYCY